MTMICFLAYPAICQRLLSMYQVRQYGDWRLVEKDWSLTTSEMTTWYNLGAVYVALYVVGLPLFMLNCAYKAVKPQPKGMSIIEQIQWSEMKTRLAIRFKMLYDVYDIDAWFW